MENREKILANALGLFSSKGYDAVGVQEIASVSGITKPTLYHYFGSKEGLLNEILERYSRKLYKILLKASEYNNDIILTLENVAKAYFTFAQENADFYRFQLALWFAPPNSSPARAVEKFLHEQFLLIETLFMKAAEDHGNMKGRHGRYAASFIGMINTYIGISARGSVSLDDRMVYLLVHQFMHGIFS